MRVHTSAVIRLELCPRIAWTRPGAIEAFASNSTGPGYFHLLARHPAGDWGDVDAEDRRANDLDLIHGGRLFSVYHLRDSTKLWCITEADRSVTTFLLPSEY